MSLQLLLFRVQPSQHFLFLFVLISSGYHVDSPQAHNLIPKSVKPKLKIYMHEEFFFTMPFVIDHQTAPNQA